MLSRPPASWAVIVLTILVLAGASPRVHAGTEPQIPLISMSLEKESMEGVLDRISRIVGYEIAVSRDWADKVISIVLQDCGLEDSLAKILAAAGNPSHVLITDKENRRIEILILGPARVGPAGTRGGMVPAQSKPVEPPVQEAEPEDERGGEPAEMSAADEPGSPAAPELPGRKKGGEVSFRKLKMQEIGETQMIPPEEAVVDSEKDDEKGMASVQIEEEKEVTESDMQSEQAQRQEKGIHTSN
ncbi:MAG: hypothetical protein CVU57_14745 [Deltaproteobacteria bacterium HGW-Deltaproteobacteria-15]|nr:MAG: hypothetical protein CVU57_14745 [Deltaproteobacteria bacterium HGW-Deltaproteobacteria-15]